MTPPGRPDPDVARLVEKQLRNWELWRAQRLARAAGPPPEVEHFVTISRMVGAGGHAVATALGERLGWPVFDRELLSAMAGDDQVRRRVYEELDERDIGWIEDTLRWLLQHGYHKEHYFHRLSATILALARQGRAIFLGRGADLILPRRRGLRVHLVAPPEVCAQELARRQNISEALARAEVERIQQERNAFLRGHFGKAADSPTRHDLVINTGVFTTADAVEIICTALRLRGIIG
jgi:cytidylate kinase